MVEFDDNHDTIEREDGELSSNDDDEDNGDVDDNTYAIERFATQTIAVTVVGTNADDRQYEGELHDTQ